MDSDDVKFLTMDASEDESNVCRACLRHSTHLQSLHINHFDLRYTDFTSLSVDSDDALPQSLCQSCCDMLLQCYIFKKMCWQSDTELRKKNQNMLTKLEMSLENNGDQDQDCEHLKLMHPNISDDQDTRFTMIDDISLEASDMDIADEFLKEMASESDNIQVTNNEVTTQIIVKIFRCIHCFKHFNNEECLEKHIQNHKVKTEVFERQPAAEEIVFKDNFQDTKNEDVAPIIGKTFKCSHCLEIFNDDDCLQRHMQIHNNVAENKCDKVLLATNVLYTEENFINAKIDNDLYDEDIASIIGKTFECLKCSKLFNDEDCLQRHLQIHKDESRIKLKMLKAKQSLARTGASLNDSKVAKSDSKSKDQSLIKNDSFKCVHCFQLFRDEYNLRKHLLILHKDVADNNKPVIIHKKKQSLATRAVAQTRKSILNENKNKAINCIHCLQPCKDQYYLKRHLRIFHNDLPDNKLEIMLKNKQSIELKQIFECKKCLQPFNEKYCLKRHLRIFHKDIPEVEYENMLKSDQSPPKPTIVKREQIKRVYKCERCPKTFQHEHLKDIHMNTECPEFKCELCEKTFNFKCKLIEHIKSHKDDKDLRCEKCGKLFKTKRSLLVHLIIHEDEKRYKCEFCSKSFHFHYLLKRHVITHELVANYKCEICDKMFKTKRSLSRHLEVHIGEREGYKCGVCGKVFKYKWYLSEHVLLHVDNTDVNCGICGKLFLSKQSLAIHTAIQHRN